MQMCKLLQHCCWPYIHTWPDLPCTPWISTYYHSDKTVNNKVHNSKQVIESHHDSFTLTES